MGNGQPFSFSIANTVGAELAGVSHYSCHVDIDSMIKAAEAMIPLCERLGVPTPRPGMWGMSYNHVSTLGVEIVNGPDKMEPSTKPCIHSVEQIDDLREPDDYLQAGIVPERLAVLRKLVAKWPDANNSIGHPMEGPVTSAVMMMGPDFFMLPYDDPARTHRLMQFITTSTIKFVRILRKELGQPEIARRQGMPDDFAGMFRPELFKEFVMTYWEQVYEELGAPEGTLMLHSELLREEYLLFLEEL